MTKSIVPVSSRVTLSIVVILFLSIVFPLFEPVSALDDGEVQRLRDQLGQLDDEEVQLLKHQAGQGDVEVQVGLGWIYHEGLGVPQDDVKAHKWYNLAASRLSLDDSDVLDAARGLRDIVEGGITREEVATAQRLAKE